MCRCLAMATSVLNKRGTAESTSLEGGPENLLKKIGACRIESILRNRNRGLGTVSSRPLDEYEGDDGYSRRHRPSSKLETIPIVGRFRIASTDGRKETSRWPNLPWRGCGPMATKRQCRVLNHSNGGAVPLAKSGLAWQAEPHALWRAARSSTTLHATSQIDAHGEWLR